MKMLRSFLLLAFTLGSVSFTIGCQSDDVVTVDFSGRAIYPPQYATALGEVVPVSNTPFQVLDLTREAGSDIVATGQTDQSGGYFVTVPPSSSHAIVVLGEVRVSGIVDGREGSVRKEFNGVTDIACEAGVSAVRDGSVTAAEMDETRVSRLETAAALVLESLEVDFTDADGSRTEAVSRVRALTDDGDRLPGE